MTVDQLVDLLVEQRAQGLGGGRQVVCALAADPGRIHPFTQAHPVRHAKAGIFALVLVCQRSSRTIRQVPDA